MVPFALFAVVVAIGATILLAVRMKYSVMDSRPFRLQLTGAVMAAGLTVLCLLGAVRSIQQEQDIAAQRQAQFVEQIQPVVDELRRLGIKPMVKDGFYDTDNYRTVKPNNPNVGMVAVKNAQGRKIWIGYEIRQNDRSSIGCFVDGKVYPTTPAGAMQLLSTRGCDL